MNLISRSVPHKKITLFFIVLLLFPSTSSCLNAGQISTAAIVIEFEDGLERVSEKVLAMYPALKSEIEHTLDWPLDFRIHVHMLHRAAFQNIMKGKQAAAYAVPEKHLIVIDTSKIRETPFSLDATLKHEMTHLLLHHHINTGQLPKWLDEGIAQWISGEATEILSGGKGKRFQQAGLSGRLMPLSRLHTHFPEDETSVLLAYAQSKSVVEYLHREYGISGLRRLLKTLKAGETLQNAVFNSLSLSLADLEKAWQAHLKKKVTWIAFLGNNLMLLLFTFGGLLTVYGFIRFIIKKRAYKDDEADLNDTDFL